MIGQFIIAVSLSLDAFALGTGLGISQTTSSLKRILGIALIFGIVEGMTPLVGWKIGSLALGSVQSVDHWIAFGILFFMGSKMIIDSWKYPMRQQAAHNLSMLIVLALGSSIDAMAVGIGLAFTSRDIFVISIATAIATFFLTGIGILLGRYLGAHIQKISGMIGGLGVIAIGFNILLEHLLAS